MKMYLRAGVVKGCLAPQSKLLDRKDNLLVAFLFLGLQVVPGS